MTVSLELQIACVRRELAFRAATYPKWVAQGRMKQAEADKQMQHMQAVHDTLVSLVGPEAAQ